MKFSIIIPARNEEAYISKTLQSIENQDYIDYETIVVANGCTDNTAAVAEKYGSRPAAPDQRGFFTKMRRITCDHGPGAGAAHAGLSLQPIDPAQTRAHGAVLKHSHCRGYALTEKACFMGTDVGWLHTAEYPGRLWAAG